MLDFHKYLKRLEMTNKMQLLKMATLDFEMVQDRCEKRRKCWLPVSLSLPFSDIVFKRVFPTESFQIKIVL